MTADQVHMLDSTQHRSEMLQIGRTKQVSTYSHTVVDLFCGAGGFSEGFRQAGFRIIGGYDLWPPAVETFKLNQNTECKALDLLYATSQTEFIQGIPDADIIIGSPPCVSFSSSNRMGSADKSNGLLLIKAFLRVVAVKLHSEDSRLKGWVFENVPNVEKYLKQSYTFQDLDLGRWARSVRKNPKDVAVECASTGVVIDSSSHGVAQRRKRYFAGGLVSGESIAELVARDTLSCPEWRIPLSSMKQILSALGPPNSKRRVIKDPTYRDLSLTARNLTDHFYDTSIHAEHAQVCKRLKKDHPYMGRMSFPDDINRSSRTITATDLPRSREAIVLPSEWGHKNDGTYRTLTVREAASIMTFPITYQFVGTRAAKWKMVGNAVCPTTAAVIAQWFAQSLRLTVRQPAFTTPKLPAGFTNLNKRRKRNFPPLNPRPNGARFRRHALKQKNITVALSNYWIGRSTNVRGRWHAFIVCGTGKGFSAKRISPAAIDCALTEISKSEPHKKILRQLERKIVKSVPGADEFQRLYESRNRSGKKLCPDKVINLLSTTLERVPCESAPPAVSKKLFGKSAVSLRHCIAIVILGRTAAAANGG